MEDALKNLSRDVNTISSSSFEQALERFADMPNTSIDYAVAENGRYIGEDDIVRFDDVYRRKVY